ncbi:ferric reductase-like transmembrane domain-containing protein [uncultured Tateyamaria sp.]|uniref:ferredoxin reductase family protein n=1 Tax=uncultured Tateyamaria sp. TaxID=455651 RepID=UPI002633F527|nr:ferric reductase-like transmembrane domain-containing protein [uncultured Tateyamaria sp.]
MNKTSLFIAAAFAGLHVAVVAPFVPLASVVPAALGMLAMTSMALTLILAARWRVVDVIMGGPDKSYGAHRWLGFFALFGAMGHWATAEAIGAGLAPLLAESGEEVGTLAAMGLLVMTGAAMVRAIPYHLWKASHMLMGPVFLLAAYHTFFVASPLAVGAVPWTLMAVVSGVGLLAWGQTLWRKIVPTRLVTVDQVTPFEDAVEVRFVSDAPLSAFRPGQFATLAHNRARAEAHPFTIAGGDARSRSFVIRDAGDWTGAFVRTVAAGDRFRISRAVGRFLPQVGAARKEQLWVAGGVGITPFMAAMERMQPDDGARVTLLYCIRSRETAGGIAAVEAHARRLPQLDLVVLSNDRGEGLTPARFAEIAGALPAGTQVYLCGPEGLKGMVTRIWTHLGKTGRIHSERFDFRGAIGLTEMIYIGKSVLQKARITGQTHAPSRS